MKQAWQILAHRGVIIQQVTCVADKNKQL